ncbi:MAG: hypothetical protein QNJ13_05130 [Paracoccaceae bacterium]|nr:hypothetical protein [Paracoccaceae bacterium]
MPLQNRVLPTGEIVADPARGMFTGNRGILHRPDRTLGVARWRHPHWLICALDHPRGVYHGAMPERGWTALFFLDEAVAIAAGHRPCAYCRREAFGRFRDGWAESHGGPARAGDIDAALHRARVRRTRAQLRYRAEGAHLPQGTLVLAEGRPLLLLADRALPYRTEGYRAPVDRPRGAVTVLTPAPAVAVLAAGYAPLLHPTAAAA